jgi:hypothetical protein
LSELTISPANSLNGFRLPSSNIVDEGHEGESGSSESLVCVPRSQSPISTDSPTEGVLNAVKRGSHGSGSLGDIAVAKVKVYMYMYMNICI